jgi:DNA gyrase subunit A
MHRTKLAAQWTDPSFGDAQREGVRRSNARRLAARPDLMRILASRAAVTLRRNWTDSDYRRRVMRRKVARYASDLLARFGGAVTPDVYASNRTANWIPRLDAAMAYFRDFNELLEAGRTYNHRVISVRQLAETEDVYDITVDHYHNFLLADGVFVHNSIDGDAPAAMRYTEARLMPLAVEMLNDLEKNTVDFRPNYDETREEPVVLPSVVPNLLINGCSGIAVGMATEVPPHNLTEICDAIMHVIDHPDAPGSDLLGLVKGPDFPTGGIIYGTQGIHDCYSTGRGLMKVRARVQVEEGRAGRMSLVATEIPFQVNKSALLEKIADLVRDGRVNGISDLRDESDRDGMRIVIELKKDANPKVVLNQLFVHSPLQTTFGAIMLALVDNRPQVLTLKGLIEQYVLHRQIVVRRRTEYDLAEAEKRAHILEGLKIALDHLDQVIALIRAAKDVETARQGLITTFKLSEIQATAILEMRLQRLTGLERSKIEQEYLEVIQLIEQLKSILASPQKMLEIIKDEVRRLKEKYGDERRTQIVAEEGDIDYEDTIEQKDMVITISHAGYIKRQEINAYRSQRRGGKGVIGARTKEEDYIEHLFIANTHAYLLILTDRGRCYWLKVHEIDQAGRMAKGRPLVNHLEGMGREERVQAVVPVKEFDDQHYLVCATRKGLIKKTVLSAYGNVRKAGINAILLEEGDALIEGILTDGTQDIVLAKKKGLAIRFHENEVRPMGRTSYGVKAVTLDDAEDEVVSMVTVKRQATLLAVTEHGYGKRSEISEYRATHRGGKGIITIKTTERNGFVVAVKEIVDGDELMIITRSGQMIRMPVSGISVIGRNTQGVRLVNLAAAGEGELLADTVSGVTRVVSEEDAEAVPLVGAGGNGTEGNGSAPEE